MNQPDLWNAGNNNDWRDYSEALTFARGLNLNSKDDWDRYIEGKKGKLPILPYDVPPDPDIQYRFLGWKSWEVWLGISSPELLPEGEQDEPDIFKDKGDESSWMEFKPAREIIWEMGFEYKEEWEVYNKGLFPDRDPLPENIPKNPDKIYRFTGWRGWTDWLVSPDRKINYTDFYTARDFVRSMRFINKEAWRAYITGEDHLHLKYELILPNMPDLEYSNSSWIGWENWLGKDIDYKSYHDTRRFVHSLGLKSEVQWRSYCLGGFEKVPPKPVNIFSYPEIGYRNSGWISWEDWLGPGKVIKNNSDKATEMVECRCKGRIKDCPECDGKGYYTVSS